MELYSHLIPEHLSEARNVVSFSAEAVATAKTNAERTRTSPR